jgi:AcrR family transcriptional regulator
LSVDHIVEAAIALADSGGFEQLTMRTVARSLSVSPMTLYSYVPSKDELLDLMVDQLFAGMERPPWGRKGWRSRARAIAEDNRDLYSDHPWLARVSTARPPLGPGAMAKYDHELGAFDGLGLSDAEMDGALTFLLGFVQQSAAIAHDVAEVQRATGTEAEWWAAVGPEFERYVQACDYPLAARVGTSVGSEQDGAYDADRAYRFGLERIIDGLATMIESP